jgi:hypothetical protein
VWGNGPDQGCRGVFTCDGVTDVVCDIDGDGIHSCPCKKGNRPSGGHGHHPAGPPPPPNPVKHNCKGTLNEVQKIVLLNKGAPGATAAATTRPACSSLLRTERARGRLWISRRVPAGP